MKGTQSMSSVPTGSSLPLVAAGPCDQVSGDGVPARCEACDAAYELLTVELAAAAVVAEELEIECPDCGGPVYVVHLAMVEGVEASVVEVL
jgi:hypothetical protein